MPVPVPTRLIKLHPHIAATRAEIGNRRSGWIDTRRQAGMLHIHATARHARRVLLLAQALVDEAERRGHSAKAIEAYGCTGGLGIFVGSHGYELVFAEGSRRLHHEPTDAERERLARNSWTHIPSWDYIPSGRVELRTGHSTHDKPLGGDRTRWKLEDRLGRALDTIETLAAAAEQRDQEQRDREAQERAEWEAAMDRARDRYRETRRAEHLQDQLERWRLAIEIRTFIVEGTATGGTSAEASSEWLAWAARYADAIDPLRGVLVGPEEIEPTADALVPYLDGWSPYGPTRGSRWG